MCDGNLSYFLFFFTRFQSSLNVISKYSFNEVTLLDDVMLTRQLFGGLSGNECLWLWWFLCGSDFSGQLGRNNKCCVYTHKSHMRNLDGPLSSLHDDHANFYYIVLGVTRMVLMFLFFFCFVQGLRETRIPVPK